jgi:hypothetical protein
LRSVLVAEREIPKEAEAAERSSWCDGGAGSGTRRRWLETQADEGKKQFARKRLLQTIQ